MKGRYDDAAEDALSHKTYGARTDQSLQLFVEVHRSGESLDCVFVFLYERKMDLLQVLKSWKESFTSLSQREPFDVL